MWLHSVFFVFPEDFSDTLLQAHQTNKLRVGRVRYEVHLWWRRLGWWNLEKKCKIKIFVQKCGDENSNRLSNQPLLKSPPPEMYFIPNPANMEFICLMGLEECVTKIPGKDKENTVQPHPLDVQCFLCLPRGFWWHTPPGPSNKWTPCWPGSGWSASLVGEA